MDSLAFHAMMCVSLMMSVVRMSVFLFSSHFMYLTDGHVLKI